LTWIKQQPVVCHSNGKGFKHPTGASMKAIVDLFSTDYGLFSIAVITGTIGMAWWFSRFFKRKIEESERNDKR
jgi:hypothetical protein